MRRVLICGSRNIKDSSAIRKVIEELLALHGKLLIIHGGQRSYDKFNRKYFGVDYLAGEVAKALGCDVKVYPADWDTHGLAAGPIRNSQMLDDGKPDEVRAFHEDPKLGRGTRDMVRKARAAKVPTMVHLTPVGWF